MGKAERAHQSNSGMTKRWARSALPILQIMETDYSYRLSIQFTICMESKQPPPNGRRHNPYVIPDTDPGSRKTDKIITAQ